MALTHSLFDAHLRADKLQYIPEPSLLAVVVDC